jgi:beta-lactam-binding protein with PASTA domain
VPSLKGRTKSFASALLKAAGCKLGKTKTKKVKKGKSGVVTTQTTKAGSVVRSGTAVGITLTKVAKKK